jgi:hypothetical protein
VVILELFVFFLRDSPQPCMLEPFHNTLFVQQVHGELE